MFSVKVLLGLYPSTTALESRKMDLEKEYKEFQLFTNSEELAHYLQLQAYLRSKEFEDIKSHYASLNYENSEEQKKEKLYLEQKKSVRIKSYYATKASQALKDFLALDNSKELNEYYELKTYIESPAFVEAKRYLLDKKKFEKSEEYKVLLEYIRLKKDASIKAYLRFIGSSYYKGFQKYDETDALKYIQKLTASIQTSEFQQKKHSMKAPEFYITEEGKLFKEYESIVGSKEYKEYKKLIHSRDYKAYKQLHQSEEWQKFEDLEKYIQSSEFKESRRKIESTNYKESSESKKEQEFLGLKNSKKLKDYFNFKGSKAFSIYRELAGSKEMEVFEALEKYILSEEFRQEKEYLLDKKKFEKSDIFKKVLEYHNLKHSDKIKWYFSLKDGKIFDEIKKWKLTFEDEFNGKAIDTEKWMGKYFWGEALLNQTYSLSDELQAYTDNAVRLDNSIAKLEMKKENVQGVVWDANMGFLPRAFKYSSGMLSTANSIRQLYGKFEAKVKFQNNSAFQAFWMVGEKMLPHIDVAKYENGRLHMANFWNSTGSNGMIGNSISRFSGAKFTRDFYIYTLEWTAEKLEWKINGISVKVQTDGVPSEPMYVSFNLGLHAEALEPEGVTNLEVDWIRCYQLNK
jgi:beta-glucanase (GH16 family)